MISGFREFFGRQFLTRIPSLLTSGALHLLGSACLFAISVFLIFPAQSRQALQEAYHQGMFASVPFEVWIHAGLSICAWAIVFIVWKLVSSYRQENKKPRLVRAQGAVILETILVFPVFLLITLGLMQLALLNSAAMLTNLGAFKAARAAAVWYPEAESERNGVDATVVEQKMRLAAASAVAPMAPADFSMSGCNETGNPFLQARLNALDAQGQSATSIGAGQDHGSRSNLSVLQAFDSSSFGVRGQRKLRFAYCATDVSIDLDTADGTVEVTVVYEQQMAMPIVEVVFGEWKDVAGRSAFYAAIARQHTTPHQLFPNNENETPGGWVDLGDVFSGTGADPNMFD